MRGERRDTQAIWSRTAEAADEAVRIVDMSTSNAWAEFAGIFLRTGDAHLAHERAKAELKDLVPVDARQAIGHGVCAKRSKAGAITFELLKREEGNATV